MPIDLEAPRATTVTDMQQASPRFAAGDHMSNDALGDNANSSRPQSLNRTESEDPTMNPYLDSSNFKVPGEQGQNRAQNINTYFYQNSDLQNDYLRA